MAENQNIEWKESWRDEYLKWICGFANAVGGKIYIGVNDDGKVVGVADCPKLLEDIPNKVRDVLGIIVDVKMLEDGALKYIEIDVPAYPNPINYKGQYFYRTGSTKQELKGASLNKFLMQRTGKTWDECTIDSLEINDLSIIALERFRKEAAGSHRVDDDVINDTAEHLLEDLRLIDEESGLLTRAAVLLFHPDPEKYVRGAFIKIGFFNSVKEDLMFQDEIHGPIMEQIDKTLELLKTKYLVYRISYSGASRKETLQFPEEAVRESLMNAIAHKDYSDGTPIQISVYPDHIVFWNPGQLPQDWNVERLLKKHPSKPHNPSIANTMFRSGDIESWGRGYTRILEAVSEYKLLPPTIDVLSGLMITYYTNVNDQLQSLDYDQRQIAIVEHTVNNGKITNSDVQKLLNVSKATAFRILTSLSEILEVHGSTGKGTYYTIKGFINV
mgnify:CR=1 FL=1